MEGQPANDGRACCQTIGMAGRDLVERVKDLMAKGRVRRLVIRNQRDEIMLRVPLTGSVIVAALLLCSYPFLLAVAAISALVARAKIEVVRVE